MKTNTVFIVDVVIKIFLMNNMIIIDNKQNLNNIWENLKVKYITLKL